MLLIACFFIILALVVFFYAVGVLGDTETAAAARLRSIRETMVVDGEVDLDASEEYGFAGRITPKAFVDRAERNLMLAGRPDGWSVAKVLSMKVILASFGLALGLLLLPRIGGGAGLFLLIIATALGYFIPDVLLASRARSRQEEIQRDLPDLLDQVTIAIESGSSFESALARVGQTTEGALTEEIVRTIQDTALGMARRDAYTAMAERTDVEDMRRFTRAVIQGEEFGVPMADVVRDQAQEMRVSRRLRAEATANKIPVKMLLPLIGAIMPVLFLVILGPAVIGAIAAFNGG